MERKIIFLDIDGVLATHLQFMMNRTKYRKKHPEADELRIPYPFDEECVGIFNEIIEKTDADIVLSSDWKLHWDLEEIDKVFKYNRVAKSPFAFTENDAKSFGNITLNRAWEIDLYIRANDIDNFVVIDDLWVDKYMKFGVDEGRIVRTKDMEGLKQTGIKEKIINILNLP
jgi:hypothetical protein